MSVYRVSPLTTYGPLRVADLHLVNIPGDAFIYVGRDRTGANLRYNKGTSKWQFSNDGVTWENMGTGGGVSGSFDDSVKIAELVETEIPTNTNHILPGSYVYTMGGNKLDVYFNGQLLTHDQPSFEYDYKEVDSNTIRFHFIVPRRAVLLYIIKQ